MNLCHTLIKRTVDSVLVSKWLKAYSESAALGLLSIVSKVALVSIVLLSSHIRPLQLALGQSVGICTNLIIALALTLAVTPCLTTKQNHITINKSACL